MPKAEVRYHQPYSHLPELPIYSDDCSQTFQVDKTAPELVPTFLLSNFTHSDFQDDKVDKFEEYTGRSDIL